MTTYDAIVLNDTTIKVKNDSDYYIDQWVDTDYGFELWYRKPRGIVGGLWNKLLDEYRFSNREMRIPYRAFNGCFYVETYAKQLDLAEFLSMSFVLNFISGNKPYSIMFDRPSMTLMISDTESYWDYL